MIKVERFTTGITKDFLKSMALLIISFYVFKVEYPSKIENSLTFIQKFFLDMSKVRERRQLGFVTLNGNLAISGWVGLAYVG